MDFIRKKRRQLKMRLEDLSPKVNISRARLGELETKGTGLKVEEFIRVCNALGLRVIVADENATFDVK